MERRQEKMQHGWANLGSCAAGIGSQKEEEAVQPLPHGSMGSQSHAGISKLEQQKREGELM